MKTKLITLGYGFILATCLVKAGLSDEEDSRSSEPLDRSAAVEYHYAIFSRRQFLTVKYLCVLLGEVFHCPTINSGTPVTEDIITICNVFGSLNLDTNDEFSFHFPPKSKKEMVRLTSEILQSQPKLNSNFTRYYLKIRLSEAQYTSFRNLCIRLCKTWECNITEDAHSKNIIEILVNIPRNRPDAVHIHCDPLTKKANLMEPTSPDKGGRGDQTTTISSPE